MTAMGTTADDTPSRAAVVNTDDIGGIELGKRDDEEVQEKGEENQGNTIMMIKAFESHLHSEHKNEASSGVERRSSNTNSQQNHCIWQQQLQGCTKGSLFAHALATAKAVAAPLHAAEVKVAKVATGAKYNNSLCRGICFQ